MAKVANIVQAARTSPEKKYLAEEITHFENL